MASLSKKGQETRQTILNSAFDLFHERGIHATSIDDILKKSGAGKSQFYHYFKNKEDILHELLQGACHMIKEGHTHMQPIHSWSDFRSWLNAAIDKQKEFGCARACPIGQIGGELSEDDEILRKDIDQIFDIMKEFPRAFFIEQKKQGKLKDTADPESMATMCIASMQGAALLTKISQNSKEVEDTANHLYSYMQSFIK